MASRSDRARDLLEQGCDSAEREEFSSAYAHFLRSAKLGNAEAQVSLANMLDDGPGVLTDPVKAVYWYKKAVRSGCAYGASGLGIHYRNIGKRRWAIFWLKRAVLMGDDWASQDLAELDCEP